jgi:malonyl-CoA O-methyltransferase
MSQPMTRDNDATPQRAIDKARVRASFERAVASYDEHAVLQKEVGERLLERLDYVRLQPRVVVDVGAGTGLQTAPLAKRYRGARIVALDLAHAMLVQARRRGTWLRKPGCLVGDAERLPLADGSCDLLFSNLALQWVGDLDRALREFRRVLRPGGLLMFTTLGPDTLYELRECWSRVDGYTHVGTFEDMHDVGDALVRARFAEPVMDAERLTMTYADLRGLMRDLKGIGAHNATGGRERGLTGRRRMQALMDAYESFRRDGVLPATYEVVYGHAWAPESSQQVTLDALRGRRGGGN